MMMELCGNLPIITASPYIPRGNSTVKHTTNINLKCVTCLGSSFSGAC